MPDVPVERRALTIREFCAAVGIARSGYYHLRSLGLGPRTFKLSNAGWSGGVRIPVDEVDAWIRRRAAASQKRASS